MRFKNLTIKGAIPFRDETVIHFPDSQTVALTGDNGAGKSTVFDCIFAAIYGDVTKPNGVYSLFEGSKDGLIELDLEMDGHDYKLKRLINGNSRTQKPWFYMDGVALTEGKKAQFDECVSRYIGISADAFLAGVYNCQTQKGNPLQLGDKERRSLLTEILGLQQFEEPYQLVKENDAEARNRIEQVAGQLTQLMADNIDIGEAKALVSNAEEAIRLADEKIKNTEGLIDSQVKSAATLQAEIKAADEVAKQLEKIQAVIADKNTKIKDFEARISKNKTALIDRADEINAAHQKVESLTAEMAELQKQKDLIVSAIDQQHHTRLGIVSMCQEHVDAKQKEYMQALGKSREKAAQVKDFEGKEKSIKDRIDVLKTQTSVMGEVPCQAMANLTDSCKLLGSARDAVTKIKELENELGVVNYALNDSVTGFRVDLKKLEDQVAKISDEQIALEAAKAEQTKDIDEQIDKNQASLAKIKDDFLKLEGEKSLLMPLYALHGDLQQADERIKLYQQNINDLADQILSEVEQVNDCKKRLCMVDENRKQLETFTESIQSFQTTLKIDKQNRDQLLINKTNTEAIIKNAEQASGSIAVLQAEQKDLAHRRELLSILEQGLGPKGARALKIDAAGPEITELVNSLLSECYGNKFTIGIKTLRELTSSAGEFRECLEFSIIDNETGNETPVENKSGGEQQLIKEVISLALCIYQRRKAGIDSRTIIRDESCSALTEENTQLYITMLAKACELGGFDQVLYVSHKSVAQSMAEAVIQVANGNVKVMKG